MKPIGVADHERESAEKLGTLAQHACPELDRRPNGREGVAIESLTDPGHERRSDDTEVAADDHPCRTEDIAKACDDTADLPAGVVDNSQRCRVSLSS